MALPSTPDEYSLQQQQLERQRKFADALRSQSQEPLQGQMVSGWYVAPSITQGLAKLLQASNAKGYEEEADTKQKALAQELATKKNEWLGAMPKTTQSLNYAADGMGPPETKIEKPSEEDYLNWAMQGMEISPAMAQAGFGMANLMSSRADRNQQLQLARDQKQSEFEAKLEADAKARKEKAEQEERLIRLTAALRPPPQAQAPVAVIGPDGKTPILVPPSQAYGRQPANSGEMKPLTEFQGKSLGYGNRAATSHQILNQLEENVSPVGVAASHTGGMLTNWALAPETQRVAQAQRDFVNAVLRQESGAAISSGEFDNARKQYFPQPGDSPEVIAQKRANREMAIKGFASSAGPRGAEIGEILATPAPSISPQQKSNPPAPGGFKILNVR